MKNKVITITLSVILFLVPILILPNSTNNYTSIKFIALLVCLLALLIGLLIKFIEERKIKFDITDILVFTFGTLALISTIFSLNVKQSIIGAPNRYEGLLSIIIYILVYYNAKYYFKNYKNFIDIGIVVYVSICILAIVQFYFPKNVDAFPLLTRGSSGTFGNTNFIGSFISIILPIFIISYIFTKKNKYLISSVISFCALTMCLARSAWVAFVIYILMIIGYLIIKKNKDFCKRALILILIFVISSTAIFFSDKQSKDVLNKRINLIGKEVTQITKEGLKKEMGAGRIQIWIATLSVIYKAPILGCGVDALEYGLKEFAPEKNMEFILKYNKYIDKAHNEYLHIAATMGIPAVIIYLTFISIIVIINIRKIKNKKISTLVFIVIISYLTQAFFNISTISVAPIFWFVLGFASRNSNLKQHIIELK